MKKIVTSLEASRKLKNAGFKTDKFIEQPELLEDLQEKIISILEHYIASDNQIFVANKIIEILQLKESQDGKD